MLAALEALGAPGDLEVKSAIAALKASGLRLSKDDFDALPERKPPPMIEAAGPEFVAAWSEFRRAASLRKKGVPGQGDWSKHWDWTIRSNEMDPMEAYEARIKSILQSVELSGPGDSPSNGVRDWCGTLDNSRFHSQAYKNNLQLLACLRAHRFGDAFELLSTSGTLDQVFVSFVEALGFDSQMVLFGAWLHGKRGALELFSQRASDASARLILRWAKLHVKEVAALEIGQRESRHAGEPQVPGRELLNLLYPGDAVSKAAKEEIAAFINSEEAGLKKPR